MFVREWGDVLIRNPDKIQQYFAKVLGHRGFWYVKDNPAAKANVSILSTVLGYQDMETSCAPIWQSQPLDMNLIGTKTGEASLYVTKAFAKIRGSWNFQHFATVKSEKLTAVVARYSLASSNDFNDSDDSDEESADEDAPKQGSVHVNVLWFLCITDGIGKTKWFHHTMKTGNLQKSVPIFVDRTPWLLWPQGESTLLKINVNTFESSEIQLPLLETKQMDFGLVHQGKPSHRFIEANAHKKQIITTLLPPIFFTAVQSMSPKQKIAS
jgi:hypothetical protein